MKHFCDPARLLCLIYKNKSSIGTKVQSKIGRSPKIYSLREEFGMAYSSFI